MFGAVSECLGLPGEYCPGSTLAQYGGAVFWSLPDGRAVLDSRSCAVATQRMWQVIEVDVGGQSLRICNIHLPSGRQLGQEQAALQRVAELDAMLRSCVPGPDIIVGDFNEKPDGPIGSFLARHGFVDAAVVAQRADGPTSIRGRRGDYIWLRRELAGRILAYGVTAKEDFSCEDMGKEFLSDHLPLWINLEVG